METDDVKLESLTERKSFDQLSNEEKGFVLRMVGSEEAYEALRAVEGQLQRSREGAVPVPPSNIDSLKEAVRGHHEGSSRGIFFAPVPAYALVVIAVVAALLGSWITGGRVSPVRGAEVVRVDTVYVDRIDTVFTERTVLRTVLATSVQPCLEKKQSIKESAAPARGVSLQDNEELAKLLVSGSER